MLHRNGLLWRLNTRVAIRHEVDEAEGPVPSLIPSWQELGHEALGSDGSG